MTDRICERPGCGTALGSTRTDQRYCSAACRQAAYRGREASQSRNAQPSQADRVLAALVGNPERGITQVDFLRLPTIDGLPPITRLAARVLELREQGHEIVSGETRERCRVYRLVPAAGSAPGQTPNGGSSGVSDRAPSLQRDARPGADPTAGGQLFETADQEFDAAVPPLSPYDKESA